jgi:hypothetical protein
LKKIGFFRPFFLDCRQWICVFSFRWFCIHVRKSFLCCRKKIILISIFSWIISLMQQIDLMKNDFYFHLFWTWSNICEQRDWYIWKVVRSEPNTPAKGNWLTSYRSYEPIRNCRHMLILCSSTRNCQTFLILFVSCMFLYGNLNL